MKTKFNKFEDNQFPNKWSRFLTAGDSWLKTLEVLEENRDRIGWGVFYVIPQIVAFCLELYVKAIVSHFDNTFKGREYSHKTTKIINEYKDKIKILNDIYSDSRTMDLIKEYEHTIDTRFGDTSVSIDGNDQQIVINTIHQLREELHKITKL